MRMSEYVKNRRLSCIVEFNFKGARGGEFFGRFLVDENIMELSFQPHGSHCYQFDSIDPSQVSRGIYPDNANAISDRILRAGITLLRAEYRDVGDAICSWASACGYIKQQRVLTQDKAASQAERIAYLESRVMELKEEVRKARQR